MKKKIGFWDYLLWGGAIVILVWALLKIFGIIKTPLWINMIPIIAGAVSLLGAAYKFGKIIEGVEKTNKKVDDILKIKEDFQKVKHNQKLCLSGKLKESPYKYNFKI